MVEPPDDDYLSQDIVQRTLAGGHLAGAEDSLPDALLRAASLLKLPPHIRLLRLRLPAWFYMIHPRLGMRLMVLQHGVRDAMQTETRGQAQMALAKCCENLLDAIECARDKSSWIGDKADKWTMRLDDGLHQLRSALALAAVCPMEGQQKRGRGQEVDKPPIAAWAIGLPSASIATFFRAFRLCHFVRCAKVDWKAVKQFIDHGEFNLSDYVHSFRPGWRLAIFHPIVYRRHIFWRKRAGQLTPGTPEFWDLLLKEERNLATAEFGRLSISIAERARLRHIRQLHDMEWWTLRNLVCNLGAKGNGQKLQLREPPKLAIQAIGIVRKAWAVISCYLVLGAFVQLLFRGCLDCSAAGVFMLAPMLLVVWWFLHVVSDGWQSSFQHLRAMSI